MPPAHGEHRDHQNEPTSVEIPNLVVHLAESHADDFYRWHEDFVINGNNGEDREKGGTLEYLTPNLQEVLFTLNFYHLGVFKVSPDKVTPEVDQQAQQQQQQNASVPIRRLKVEMYCEDIQLNFNASAMYGAR